MILPHICLHIVGEGRAQVNFHALFQALVEPPTLHKLAGLQGQANQSQ